MRYVNGFFCVLMVLFTVVQYNDPDAILWILIYGLTAVWAGLAAFRPDRFAHNSAAAHGFRRDPGRDRGRRDLRLAAVDRRLVGQRVRA